MIVQVPAIGCSFPKQIPGPSQKKASGRVASTSLQTKEVRKDVMLISERLCSLFRRQMEQKKGNADVVLPAGLITGSSLA